MREKKILKALTVIGFLILPFLFKKQPIKDWVLVFCLKAFYSGFIDSFMVAHQKVKYPIRLFQKEFKIHVLFDLLLFPIACVVYNQLTHRSSIIGILTKVFYFSIPITFAEYWAEKNTKLIKYRNGWNIVYSFLSLTLSFWLVRASIGLIRKYNKPI